MISTTTQVKVNNDQVSCELNDEAAILDMKTGIYYGLDPVGARIWELIQQPRAVSSIVASLLEEYDVAEADCTQDAIALLTDLQKHQLIEICD